MLCEHPGPHPCIFQVPNGLWCGVGRVCAKHGSEKSECQAQVPEHGRPCEEVCDDAGVVGAQSAKPWLWPVAGIDCSGAARNGKQKGTLGPSRFGHVVWHVLGSVGGPAVSVGECATDWLPIDFREGLPCGYKMAQAQVASQSLASIIGGKWLSLASGSGDVGGDNENQDKWLVCME